MVGSVFANIFVAFVFGLIFIIGYILARNSNKLFEEEITMKLVVSIHCGYRTRWSYSSLPLSRLSLYDNQLMLRSGNQKILIEGIKYIFIDKVFPGKKVISIYYDDQGKEEFIKLFIFNKEKMNNLYSLIRKSELVNKEL